MWQHVVAGVRTTVCRWQVTTRWHHSPATITIRYQSSATITRAHHSPATITRGHHSQIPINRGHHLSARQYKGQLQVSEEVAEALHQQAPVVALESTIITHGMPYPHNLSTAHMVEAVVRENGAVPATIAILNGKIHIGRGLPPLAWWKHADTASTAPNHHGPGEPGHAQHLSQTGLTSAELERLAVTDSDSIKTSRRDLPYVLSQGLTGGTTVSSTMIAAHMAGIDVFMTGGVGGVHRGAESTMDVSADLTELGRTPVAVISAGIKSILDIGRTLEFLETEGVCVATLGSTKDFPAFFTPTSGFQSPYNVPTPAQAAKLIDMSLSVGLGSGVLIAVPIPEEQAAGGAEIEAAIQTAVHEAVERNVAGKDVTPFILARVNELTEGRSLTANIALIRNNAMKGGQIAVELSKLRGLSSMNPPQSPSTICTDEPCVRTISRIDLHEVDLTHACRPVVVGGINVDFTARVRVPKPKANGATYPGDVCQSFGGVGRNLASCLSRLGDNPLFISAMGKDNYAEYFTQQAAHMDLRGMQLCEGVSSAMYCAILGVDGELMYGLGDFVVHDQITPDYVSQFAADLKSASLVCLDGNIPKETIACITDMCHEVGVPGDLLIVVTRNN